MIRAYDQIYLNNAMRNIASMMDHTVNDLMMDADEYFELFIRSGICEICHSHHSVPVAVRSTGADGCWHIINGFPAEVFMLYTKQFPLRSLSPYILHYTRSI